MFGTSGIRGPVGDVVTADLALDVGRAVAADTRTVVVGRDARTTGAVLADALSAGLRECGTDVIRLGVVSTPTLARSVEWFDADAGVGITASHNPAPDNGIKLWTRSGQSFPPDRTADIEDRLASDVVDHAAWDDFGTETAAADDPSQRHVDRLADVFDPNADRPLTDLSVVVDLGNGTGRATVDALYELGATVHTLDGQRDGRFPARKSEPNAETLTTLAAAVPALDADVGIAHDGDSDRMMAVTGGGEFVPGDLLLALFARDAVERAMTNAEFADTAPHVAVPVDTSLVVADAVTGAGGDVEYTPVGDVHVAEAASDEALVFGGEPSGAWIWPGETLAPDGHHAALSLAVLVQQRGPLAALVDSLPAEQFTTRRANVEVDDRAESMTAIESVFRDRFEEIDTIDGLRVETDEGWFLVRPSGTEPLVRVTAEAREESHADELLELALEVVNAESVGPADA
ncbi:phosphoglucosamine mutase [Halobellus sp. Atlit-38R]|uniref:phosphopentomutase/phosphoglucosamine mutase n=1 Tax=Halobellus sp. Atlit-38R TaxID=2282131 RepID=UPI000EF21CC0|nr:phosphopentomutase/phosphoglucosamine mutase [Halobellus sp. Atlit-38R]RLM88509.1 phosphoglucosamine mutase [Halobellus sp. Atlit-38R]